jgi:hypothetical protein
MFNPSRDQVRQFFIDTWHKHKTQQILSPLEANPFLHLSMHLAIAEQLSIDHPRGIRDACDKLASRTNQHEAVHEIMECLGTVVWESQRLGKALDSDAYIELIRQRVSRD